MDIYISYGIVAVAVMLFGINFACTDKLRAYCGSGMGSALFQTAVCSGLGALILLAINGFKIEFSPFSFFIATASGIGTLLFNFCSLKALDRINLSLYSLFSMLGGMMLPFIAGILFFDEKLTVAKCVCFAVICVSLILMVERGGSSRGYFYYAAIFTLNGLFGVLTTLYSRVDGENVSSTGFSFLSALIASVLSALFIPFFRKELTVIRHPFRALGVMFISGATNRVAGLLLVIALAVLPASAQYPMVTGGVMIAATVIALFSRRKPSGKEILSVILAFFGIMALVLIPV